MNPSVDLRDPVKTADKWFGHLATIGRWLGQNAQQAYRAQQFANDRARCEWVKAVMTNLANTTLSNSGIADFQEAQFFCDYTAGFYCPAGYFCDGGVCMPNSGGDSAVYDAQLFAHLKTIGNWVGRNAQVKYQKLPMGVDRVAWVKNIMRDLKTNMPYVVADPANEARFFCDGQHACPAGYVCDGGICVPA